MNGIFDKVLLTEEEEDRLIVERYKHMYFIDSVKVKKLDPKAKLPEVSSEYAAGADVFACLDQSAIVLAPGETAKISTGLAIEPPSCSWVGVFARSGLATKEGLRPANCVGVVDSDYRGPIIVAVHNDSNQIRFITDEEKIAQLILFPKYEWKFEEVEELSDTDRGAGGFGSTGK